MPGLENYRLDTHAGSSSSTSRESASTYNPQRGTLWGEPYRTPMQGMVNVDGQDEPVLILQIGDQPGASDVLLCVGRDGILATVKRPHVRVTAIAAPGGAFLPIGALLGQAPSQPFPPR